MSLWISKIRIIVCSCKQVWMDISCWDHHWLDQLHISHSDFQKCCGSLWISPEKSLLSRSLCGVSEKVLLRAHLFLLGERGPFFPRTKEQDLPSFFLQFMVSLLYFSFPCKKVGLICNLVSVTKVTIALKYSKCHLPLNMYYFLFTYFWYLLGLELEHRAPNLKAADDANQLASGMLARVT